MELCSLLRIGATSFLRCLQQRCCKIARARLALTATKFRMAVTMAAALAEQLQNPTNVFLLAVLVYLLYPILTASNKLPTSTSKVPKSHLESYSWMPEKHPESIVWRSYTPRQLRAFDGTAGPHAPILFAIRGKIYDVTSGRGFYGPGGPYGKARQFFALRDIAERPPYRP